MIDGDALPLADPFAYAVDHVGHEIDVHADDHEFRMAEGVVEAYREGIGRAILVSGDADDVPAVALDIVEEFFVVVVHSVVVMHGGPRQMQKNLCVSVTAATKNPYDGLGVSSFIGSFRPRVAVRFSISSAVEDDVCSE